MERKIKMKISYFIKGRKLETSTLHQHGILTKKFRKTLKHKSRKNVQRKEQKAHHKLALIQNASTPRTV
jgi:hypothetical protein